MAIEEWMLQKYGATMEYDDLAEVYHTTAQAMRIRNSRRRDLPPHLPGTKRRIWATPIVAAWLIAQSDNQNADS